MNSDFRDLLRVFAEHEVRYLVVGGYAAMLYSQPRFTKDIDLWLEPSPENSYLSKEALVAAKQHAGRPVDLQDLEEIRRADRSGEP